jgi:spermidine/putrescine transport system permease protein
MINEEYKEYKVATLEEYGYKDHKVARKIFKTFNAIIVPVIVFLLYLPILLIAIQSVNSSLDAYSFGHFTLKWYTKIFENRALTTAIRNTFIVSITATALSTIFGTLIAVGINALSKKNKKILVMLNNIPLLNADIVTGISLMLVFSILLPIFPYIFGFPTLLMAHMFFCLPYVILSVLPKLKELDPNLLDAALDLGVRPFRALIKVIVPAIKAGIFSGLLLAFTMSFDDFVVSYFTTGNGFDNLSIWIYGAVGRKTLTPSVYAFSTLLTITILIGLVIYNLVNKETEKTNERKNKS